MELREDRPIFLQLAEELQERILSGSYPEETQVPSITAYALAYKISPATALRGIHLLMDEKLLYKKRGLGVFVAAGAKEKLRAKRRESFVGEHVEKLVREAKHLQFSAAELRDLIERRYEDVD